MWCGLIDVFSPLFQLSARGHIATTGSTVATGSMLVTSSMFASAVHLSVMESTILCVAMMG